MPSAYGNTVQHWRSQVVADITSQTANQCTVRSRCYWHSISWGYNVSGVKGHASVGSYGSGDKTFTASSGTSASVSQLVATVTHTYTRTTSDQKITCKAVVTFNGGYHDGTSTATTTITVPKLASEIPGPPTDVTAIRNADDDIDVTWVLHPELGGITKNTIQVQVDDEDWTTLSSSLGSSVTSYTYTAGSANHRYCFRVSSTSAAGTSDYGTSEYIYTTPAAPSAVTGFRIIDTCYVSATATNIEWPDTYRWQRRINNNSAWVTITEGTTLSIIDDITSLSTMDEDRIYYRCCAIAPSGLAGSYSSSFKMTSALPRIYVWYDSTIPDKIMVNIPSGNNIKNVYFSV